MSKTIDLLNNIERKRNDKRSFYAAHAKYNEPITNENLTKAKNTLFNKVSSLEAELQSSKTTN
jgi:hypothetical protein